VGFKQDLQDVQLHRVVVGNQAPVFLLKFFLVLGLLAEGSRRIVEVLEFVVGVFDPFDRQVLIAKIFLSAPALDELQL